MPWHLRINFTVPFSFTSRRAGGETRLLKWLNFSTTFYNRFMNALSPKSLGSNFDGAFSFAFWNKISTSNCFIFRFIRGKLFSLVF